MLTFNQQYAMAQNMAVDTSTDATTFLKQQINLGQHMLEADLGIHHVEKTRTGTTVPSASSVQLPEDCVRPKAFYVISGSNQYSAHEIYDEDEWRIIQSNTSGVTSDYVRYMFVRRNTIEYYPASASALTYTIIYEAESKDMQYDDFSSGTITTATNADETIVGTGTAWSTATGGLAGRYLKITNDGQWYEIASITDATNLELIKKYQGTAITAGTSAYIIGQMPVTPGPTHHIPVYFALWHYFEGYKKDATYGAIYKNQYEQYHAWAKATYGRRYSSQVIPNHRIRRRIIGLDHNTDRHIT